MEQPMRGGGKRGRGAHHAPATGKTKARPGTPGGPKGSGLGLVLLAAAVLVGGGGLIWWETGGGRSNAQAASASGIGGPFHMRDQDGRAVDQSILKGRWSAVFFGYTFCPDVCPATLQALGGAYRQLGGKGRDFQTVFVSIDPGRDHPPQMKAYLDAQALPMRTLGLTGTPAETAAMAKAYGVYYARSGTGPDYSMDHTAVIYLMDPQGRFASPLTHDMQPAQIAGEILKAEGRS